MIYVSFSLLYNKYYKLGLQFSSVSNLFDVIYFAWENSKRKRFRKIAIFFRCNSFLLYINTQFILYLVSLSYFLVATIHSDTPLFQPPSPISHPPIQPTHTHLICVVCDNKSCYLTMKLNALGCEFSVIFFRYFVYLGFPRWCETKICRFHFIACAHNNSCSLYYFVFFSSFFFCF